MVAGTCLGSGYLGIFDEPVHVRKDWSHPYPDFSLAFASCFPGNSVSNTSPDSQVGPFYRIFHPQPLNPAWDPGRAKWHPARLGLGRHCIGVRIRSTRRVSPVVCPGPYPCRFRRAPRYGRWDRRASNSRSGSSLGARARTTAGTSLETNRGRGAIGLSRAVIISQLRAQQHPPWRQAGVCTDESRSEPVLTPPSMLDGVKQ